MRAGYTVVELQEMLGLPSIPAVRARINALRPVLEAQNCLRRGRANSLEVTPEGVQLLRRLVDLEREGYTIQAASRRVEEEVLGQADPVSRRLAEVLERLAQLEVKVADLEARVSALEQRRPWWARLLALPRGRESG